MSELPRVLHMGPSPELGGGMAAALRGLFASPLAQRYRLEMLPTYRGPQSLSRLAVYCAALLRLVLWSIRGRGRIVHVHATVRGSAYRKAVCVLLARAMRRRVVLHVHSGAGDIAGFRASCGSAALALFGAAFRAAHAVVAVSVASAEALRMAGVPGPERVLVVPNAAPLVRGFERDWNGEEVTRVAYLGGFANPAKGGDVLVPALELALARRPDLRVTMAGPGEPPVAATGLLVDGGPVSWSGWLDGEAKDRLLRDSQVFVMSSRSEGLPMALLEAMGYEMAVVATAVGGIPEVIEDGTDGLLVAAEDPEGLAVAICALVDDAGMRRRLGGSARRRVERLDDVEVADRLDELYRSLTASPSAGG